MNLAIKKAFELYSVLKIVDNTAIYFCTAFCMNITFHFSKTVNT